MIEMAALSARDRRAVARTLTPTEASEQERVIMWARVYAHHDPDLHYLYHVPNGGKRHVAVARQLEAQGVKRGVPDLALPVPRHGMAGLYIEMKRVREGVLSADQERWLHHLARAGYCAVVCYGADAAIETITAYLHLPPLARAADG